MEESTIVFALLNESGHLHPTFKLARQLRARGHDVRYLASLEVRALIEAQGFGVELLYPDLLPAGLAAADAALSTVARRRAITRRYRALIERLRTGTPFSSDLRPRLLIVDVTQPHFALWAKRAGVPFLYVNTSLPQTKDPGVPPLRSGMSFGQSTLGRAKSELAWRRFSLQRRVSARLAAALDMTPPYELSGRAAADFGLAAGELDRETVYMPQLRAVPELVLCPAALDFPREARPDRHHVASIDLERSEPMLTLEALEGGRPLVYCALGGQRYRADLVPTFFRSVLAAAERRPSWHFLLAVGAHMRPEELPSAPQVTVLARAPQLAVLKQARAMITHGGLGSVKECIMHGVPMLGVPLDVDQPGNVARVLHHGLGLADDIARATPQSLLASLDRLLEEPSFRAATRAMQARFRAVEESDLGVRVIEQQLAQVRSDSRAQA